MTAARPLEGMRIVELSSYVAVPLCGLTLAQLGAEVIRVEPMGGANDRSRWPIAPAGASLYWTGLNLGKQAIEVDLNRSAGQQLVADLVCADGLAGGILISNSEQYSVLSYEALALQRSDVIHVQLQGRRDGGTSVDYLAQAATGVPAITGHPYADGSSSRPVNQVLPAWDIATGLYLVSGLLAADRHRLLTGEGQSVRVALEDVAFSTVSTLGYFAEAHLNGVDRSQIGNDVYGSLGRDLLAGDGARFMVVVLTPRHWSDLLTMTGLADAMGRLEWDLSADFSCESDRFINRDAIFEQLEPWFTTRTANEVEDGLSRTKVLWKRYRSFREIVSNDAAQLRADPLFLEIDQPGVGSLVAAKTPLRLAGAHSAPAVAPGVGQHTRDVLRDILDLDAQAIAGLVSEGVIRADERPAVAPTWPRAEPDVGSVVGARPGRHPAPHQQVGVSHDHV